MEDSGNHRQTLGKRGEEIACRYLQNLGHTILERNFRSGHLEIDIISINAEGIHFVEVKTRKNNIQAPPQESVNAVKQKRIVQAAGRFLHSCRNLPGRDLECFFDVAAITFDGDQASVEWIPQAFIPLYL